MAPPPPPRPHGLGIAVVFDWALTAQLATQAVAAATGHLGLARDSALIAGRVAAALLTLAIGEGLRRGIRPLRVVQVAIMGLVTALGVVSAVVLLTGHGDRSLVVSTIIELTYAPWIGWRLSLPSTVRWFALGHGRAPRVSGPAWVSVMVAWSLLWGIAVAWTQSL